MARFKLTNKAVEDLNRIWAYTFEQWSEAQADTYYYQLLDCCKRLSKNPEIGKAYDRITPFLYGFRLNKHVVFYRTTGENDIEIIRILHERMDLENRLRE
ncbi:MAG: type II toxin-antitoxin system RelE/ParE family toxin [Bacteroidota bacterium]